MTSPAPPSSSGRIPFWARLYLWATERLYHEFAWAYDAVSWVVSLGRWHHWRCEVLGHVSGTRVLELGFGTGALLAEMGRRRWHAVGVELSPQMQRVAAHRLRRAAVAIPRVRGDAVHLPFADGSFDTVVCTFPSGYILQPVVLAEVARALVSPSPDSPSPRLVIGGLLVEVNSPLLRLLPWMAPTGAVARARQVLGRRAEEAGLCLAVYTGAEERVRVPVFVLEKRRDV